MCKNLLRNDKNCKYEIHSTRFPNAEQENNIGRIDMLFTSITKLIPSPMIVYERLLLVTRKQMVIIKEKY